MGTHRDAEGKPQISAVIPPAAIAGGEFQIRGKGFATKAARPRVSFGEAEAPLVIGSDSFVIARVPETASVGELIVRNGHQASSVWTCEIGIQIADGVHPVANPAVDAAGNIFTTFSGPRGQKTPVSVYKVDLHYELKPFLSDILNATALAFDRAGLLHVSSRFDGIVYQVTSSGNMSVFAEGMGVGTGLAFDEEENLYVGDRQGTIFKISPSRQIYVFATLEPSIAAYHLAFGGDGYLYVTGPTTSSFDAIYRVSRSGEVEVYFRGLGRPQGLAFDAEGRLYVAASLGGWRGIVRIGEDRRPELFVSGPNIVGLAFTPAQAMIVATNGALYRVDAGVRGRPLP
ncbi:MAG: IPT/TIG domain-containing protein [Bryobacteraceae bacterium]